MARQDFWRYDETDRQNLKGETNLLKPIREDKLSKYKKKLFVRRLPDMVDPKIQVSMRSR